MTVRIIGGGYGARRAGRTMLIRSGETVNVANTEADRLISLGVAVAAGERDPEPEPETAPVRRPAARRRRAAT